MCIHCIVTLPVSCVIWEGNECKKVDLTALDIGWAIIDKVDNLPESSDYIVIGMVLSVLLGIVPLAYRAHFEKDQTLLAAWQPHLWIWGVIVSHSWRWVPKTLLLLHVLN